MSIPWGNRRKNELYLRLFVDDFIYFSSKKSAEVSFENKLASLKNIDFMGELNHFLGIKFEWTKHNNGNLDAYLSQEAYADHMIHTAGLTEPSTLETLYISGNTVDSIPSLLSPLDKKLKLITTMRSLVGSLLWISQVTCPYLGTINSLLAQHQANPSFGHIHAAKYAIRYLKGSKHRGMCFSSTKNTKLEAYLNFPIQHKILLLLTDAN